jgi:hypothetical protein
MTASTRQKPQNVGAFGPARQLGCNPLDAASQAAATIPSCDPILEPLSLVTPDVTRQGPSSPPWSGFLAQGIEYIGGR